MRERFSKAMTPVADAVTLAVEAGANPAAAPVLLADVADNPGGGGRGNTTWLLRALVEAGAQGRGDRRLQRCGACRRGAPVSDRARSFAARFNRAEDNAFSLPFEAQATVSALSDGAIVGRRGLLKGMAASMGPSALLQIGGVGVVVISNRQQCLDPVQLEMPRCRYRRRARTWC